MEGFVQGNATQNLELPSWAQTEEIGCADTGNLVLCRNPHHQCGWVLVPASAPHSTRVQSCSLRSHFLSSSAISLRTNATL